MNAAMIFPLRSKEGIVPLAPSDTNQFGIGKRGNVEGASPNRGYRVLKALRPSEPLAPFVGVLKLGMEAALHFLVAFDSRDHFKGEWRPCVESVSSRIRRITAPDLDGVAHPDRLSERNDQGTPHTTPPRFCSSCGAG